MRLVLIYADRGGVVPDRADDCCWIGAFEPDRSLSEVLATVAGMKIDCETCTVRGASCADCVVTFLTIGVGAPTVDLDHAERAALRVLASSGLVPPLRLTRGSPPPAVLRRRGPA